MTILIPHGVGHGNKHSCVKPGGIIFVVCSDSTFLAEICNLGFLSSAASALVGAYFKLGVQFNT